MFGFRSPVSFVFYLFCFSFHSFLLCCFLLGYLNIFKVFQPKNVFPPIPVSLHTKQVQCPVFTRDEKSEKDKT